jgi:hypothetical protein
MNTMARFAPGAVTLVRGIPAVPARSRWETRSLGHHHAETGSTLAGSQPAWPSLTLGHILFAILWLVVGAVSAIDTFLTVKYRDVMQTTEENPVGRFLIAQDGNDVSLFIGWKVAGTIACLGLLIVVAKYARPRVAHAVFGLVAAAQLALLWYLFS